MGDLPRVMGLCITSVGIVVLAALLYAAVKHQNPSLAVLAFGCAIAEATILAVSTDHSCSSP